MRPFRSLHGKILFGYCVIGVAFVALVANALVQFRNLEGELSKQQQVVTFHDAVRHARRLEKNYLLYFRVADLREALEKADMAIEALDDIRARSPWVEIAGSDVESVTAYRDMLAVLNSKSIEFQTSQVLLDQMYAVGVNVIRFGEKLDAEARTRVAAELARHDKDLLHTIWTALALALITGILVTRSVVRPLREIELSLQRVAKGETGRVEGQQSGAEVASLTKSINDTIQQLETRQEDQARASRLIALGTMLSGVAHELNNPLSNISSSCQILQEEWDELPAPSVQQLLGQIDHQVLRAQRITSTLLDFSGNRRLLQRREESARELVDEAVQLVRHEIRRELKTSVDIADDVRLNVDRMRFQQVLVNIIKNATEAMSDEGRVSIRARRQDASAGDGTVLEIEDDGPGIAPEHMARIFDPFFTTKPVGKGTGLGLSVAYEIVVQHGGVLAVDSLSGGGLCFRIHIPDTPEKAE